jgi:hypothetical protein
MITPHEIRVGVAICTPIPFIRKSNGTLAKANITVDWHRNRHGMMLPTNSATCELAVDGLEVGEARCRAVELTLAAENVPEFLFFLDYDVLVQYDTLSKLIRRARHFPEYDVFSGVYCTKSPYPEPLIYKNDGQGPYWDWAAGDLVFDLSSCHMGCTLIRTTLLEKMAKSADKPLFKSTNEQSIDDDGHQKIRKGTEDIYFCHLARTEYDAKIMADTSILCAHQDISTGIRYGLTIDSMPIQRAYWMHKRAGGKPPHEQLGLKKAVDIGAGETRREWEGHFTYTLDIRDEEGVDFVQDVRCLNLPKEDFDLVASSHFLEHMGRWEQDTVWDEMYKILKPGGHMEHIVPNLVWARDHMNNGVYNEHVYNVLYGAQEAHGYERDYNTHYFGYVPEIAYAQCQRLDMKDVQVLTFRDNPNLGYNMIIKARKRRKGEKKGFTRELTPFELQEAHEATEKARANDGTYDKNTPYIGEPPTKHPVIKDEDTNLQILPSKTPKKRAKKTTRKVASKRTPKKKVVTKKTAARSKKKPVTKKRTVKKAAKK